MTALKNPRVSGPPRDVESSLCKPVCKTESESTASGSELTPTSTEPFGATGPQADRDPATGRFVRGNKVAVVHGRDSAQFWTAADSALQARTDEILRSKGLSTADASPVLQSLARQFSQAEILRDSAFARVAECGGPATLHGRRRAAFRVWGEAADRAERLGRLLGLGRSARRLTVSERLAEVARGATTS